MHEDFAKAPESVQHYIARREEQISAGFARLGPVAKFGGEVAEVVDRHRDYFEARPNLRASQVLDNYLSFDALVVSNPAAAIIQLATQTKTDLFDLVAALQENRLNPREAVLEHQLLQERKGTEARARMRREAEEAALAEAEQAEEYQSTAQFETVKAGHLRTINSIVATLPDYDDLKHDMVAILPRVIASNPRMSPAEQIKEAHTRARRANPVTFRRMQAEASKASVKEREAARQRADNARLASSVNVQGTASKGAQSLRAAQDAAFERGMARSQSR
jgi:hypothetical protein